ncbi:class I SAM-dependent methyltransferase [Niastella vici]|nr:methyltransferase domain-containing protein [Niastella vici]
MSELHQLEEKILGRKWFYEFKLPGGKVTESYLPEYALPIHATRTQMMNEFLDTFGGQLKDLRCVDLACHEGYFSHQLIQKGVKEVTGIDARADHVEHANWIRQMYGHKNLQFKVGDIQKLTPQEIGKFDFTLLFGILYHLENVVGALRFAHAITEKVCLIETQIVPNMTGVIDWGSHRFNKEIIGCMAIIDETQELQSDNPEANTTPITIVPSLPGLLWLLKAVGFKRTTVLNPPPDAYEQLASYKRVIVAAYNF